LSADGAECSHGCGFAVGSNDYREKPKAVEALWDDLCRNEKEIPAADWQKKLLDERQRQIDTGEAKFSDWKSAKKRIRDANTKRPAHLMTRWALCSGDVLLSHGLSPYYHRGCSVSLPCSEWERVVPLRYCHQNSTPDFSAQNSGESKISDCQLQIVSSAQSKSKLSKNIDCKSSI
jgi:Putative addiction module component